MDNDKIMAIEAIGKAVERYVNLLQSGEIGVEEFINAIRVAGVGLIGLAVEE